MKWKNLNVKQYQDVTFANAEPDPFEKVCRVISVLFNLSFAEVDALSVEEFKRLSSKVEALFAEEPTGKARGRIGPYKVSFDVARYKWRQYVEIQHFLTIPFEQGVPLILASCSAPLFGKNTPEDHSKRAQYFLRAPFLDCLFTVKEILGNISALNARFKDIPSQVEEELVEGNDEEPAEPPAPAINDNGEEFLSRWGWIYTTKRIADHRAITLDAAFELSTIQALNDVQFIKDFDKYQEKQIKNAKRQAGIN